MEDIPLREIPNNFINNNIETLNLSPELRFKGQMDIEMDSISITENDPIIPPLEVLLQNHKPQNWR